MWPEQECFWTERFSKHALHNMDCIWRCHRVNRFPGCSWLPEQQVPDVQKVIWRCAHENLRFSLYATRTGVGADITGVAATQQMPDGHKASEWPTACCYWCFLPPAKTSPQLRSVLPLSHSKPEPAPPLLLWFQNLPPGHFYTICSHWYSSEASLGETIKISQIIFLRQKSKCLPAWKF